MLGDVILDLAAQSRCCFLEVLPTERAVIAVVYIGCLACGAVETVSIRRNRCWAELGEKLLSLGGWGRRGAGMGIALCGWICEDV